ncbi:unnamed protein product [Leptidea sinapis]|nr:unnamed protein product [Leptidea sinapis]
MIYCDSMMQYPNMNMMLPQQIDASQMPGMMPTMNMMGGMMPNMIDQNMMMVNQQQPMLLNNQPIFFSSGLLLPPIPGEQAPLRREKPKGCRTVSVGGLPKTASIDVVGEIFQRFGAIDDVKSPRIGVYLVRYARPESVEQAFALSGFRLKYHDQNENEATPLFLDYALNQDDRTEYEKAQRRREPTPPRVEPFNQSNLSTIAEQIKSEDKFAASAHTLAYWLERGECNKKNANVFYSLIQASNNQIRRLFNEKMQLDEEYQTLKTQIKEKFSHVIHQ